MALLVLVIGIVLMVGSTSPDNQPTNGDAHTPGGQPGHSLKAADGKSKSD